MSTSVRQSAGRIWPVGRTLPTPVLVEQKVEEKCVVFEILQTIPTRWTAMIEHVFSVHQQSHLWNVWLATNCIHYSLESQLNATSQLMSAKWKFRLRFIHMYITNFKHREKFQPQRLENDTHVKRSHWNLCVTAQFLLSFFWWPLLARQISHRDKRGPWARCYTRLIDTYLKGNYYEKSLFTRNGKNEIIVCCDNHI